MVKAAPIALAAVVAFAAAAHAYDWGKPSAPVIPQADGFFAIRDAALTPRPSETFKAVFDATRGAEKPTQILPALNMAGSELNLIVESGVPLANAKFVVVFHADGIDGILEDSAYRAKFGVANPNLAVLSELRRKGVELYVCGQNMAFVGIDPKTIAPEVRVASDALIVLMTYEMRGYALMSF
jgi:intracellular sulfur oxidation DsrE/DsrF family protein